MSRLKRLFGLRLFGLQLFGVLTLLTLTLAFAPKAYSQITINIFDFDGTLVEDRQSRDGAFNPNFILFRNNTRLNLLQEVAVGPEVVEVGQQDLEKIKPYLAAGEGRPGAIGRTAKLESGLQIKPGEYFLRNPDSFKFFREAPAGENYLLQQFQAAEHLARESGQKLFGPAWAYFVELCKTPEGARTIAISTARGHSEREWAEFFDHLVKEGYIEHKPATRRIFNMTRPEFDRFNGMGGALGGDPWNIPERKSGHFGEILLDLRNVPVPEARPGEARILHDVRFFENSPENLEALQRVSRRIIFADASPTRVTLINVGLTTDVREARERGRPEVAVLEPGSAVFTSGRRESFLLPSKPQTNAMVSSDAPSAPVTVRSCEGLFTIQGVK